MSDIALDHHVKVSKKTGFNQFWALLARYLRPQWGRVLGMALLLLAGIAIELANPQVIRYFLDSAQAGQGRSLLAAAGLFIAFSILQQGFQLAATYTSQNVGWAATNRLRADLARHCLRLDLTFHKRHTPGELIERIDGDVTGLANFFSEFTVRLLGNAMLVLGILALLFRENAWMGLGLTIYTLLTLIAMNLIQRMAIPRWKAERQAGADLSSYLEERISGAEEIKATAAEAYTMRRLYALLREFMQRRRVAFVTSSLAFSTTNLIYVLGYAGGLAVSVYLFMHGKASLGTAYLIVYYIGMLSDPLQKMREQVQDLQKSTASIQRIQELFDLQPGVANPIASQPLREGALECCFEHVSFCYDDQETAQNQTERGEGERVDLILDDISFKVQPGRVLGILGRTGSGKSTITRLLFRLYDPVAGEIRLGGVDLRATTPADLRSHVGMVTQDVQLFDAMVRENLTFFNPQITDDRLAAALKTLRLWEWVQSLPDGLSTRLAVGGQGLSAGEAQLLAFTRVFLRDPGLVILDEASSRLDLATETLVEHAVDRLFSGRTGVVIAHRLKTVQSANDILILEKGRVVEYGPRQSLALDPQSRFNHLLQTGLEEVLA